jgi:hypothetical protein
MNVAIFPTGTGSAKSAVNYLLGDTDHAGDKRSVLPEILCGDPTTFEAIANATSRKHKYTSGAISFRDGELVSDEQVAALIRTFRSTFMPGLKADENFADLWVAHRDKGNLELHFLVANTELKTGSRLNIHPPGAKNLEFFQAFVSVVNHSLGFQQVVPDPLKIALKPFEAKSPNGKTDKKAKNVLAKTLHRHILNGTIANRTELIAYVQENVGEVTRVGADYISVMLPGAEKPKRLRGELFKAGGDYKKLIAQHHASKQPRLLTAAEAQSQQEKLTACIRARAAFNQSLYLTPKPGARRSRTAKKAPATPLQDRIKQVRQSAPLGDIGATLQHQLGKLKDEATSPKATTIPAMPQGASHRPPEPEEAAPYAETAIGGLEVQIGTLSMQYQTLMLLLVTSSGAKASKLKAQLFVLEQKLSALNIELHKKKAELASNKKLNI